MKNFVKNSPEPAGSQVGNPTMGPRRTRSGKDPPDSDAKTDPGDSETDDTMEGGNSTTNVNKNNNRGLKRHSTTKQSTIDALKKFKVQHKNITGLREIVIPVVPVSNKYSLLASTEKSQQSEAKKPVESPVNESRKQRIPPIIIPNAKRSDVIPQLVSLKIEDYRLKLASVGINVFLNSADDYKSYRKLLNDTKIQYFSHDLPEEKFTRVVLKGLDNIDPEDVAKELEALEVKPVEVKTQKPKRQRYTNHVNYIVYYRRGDPNLRKVYSIERLLHTSISWEPYRNSFNGPTQCRRCLMLGHGTRHCTLSPNCGYCAGPHLSEKCEDMGKAIDAVNSGMEEGDNANELGEKVSLDDFPAKCHNCIHNGFKKADHIAFSDKCPSKQRFVQLQRQLSKSRPQQKPHKQPKPKFVLDRSAFPPLPASSNGIAFQGQQTAGRNPQPSPSTPSSFQHRMDFSKQAKNMSRPNPYPTQINNVSNDLFSFDEMMELVNELVVNMSNCSTRMEQFQVITNLTLKYVYGQSR